MINPKLQGSFFSLPRMMRMSFTRATTMPIGVITVAALLPRDWKVRVVDLNTCNLDNRYWDWADLVMISGMIIQKESMLATIQEAKNKGKRVVVGGPYPSQVPEDFVAAGCDIVFRGEAEAMMPHLVLAINERTSKRIMQCEEKPDITMSPVPRYDLLNLDHYGFAAVQTCRGCPFDCEFCDVVSLYGRKIRHKSPEQVISELEMLFHLGFRGGVFFSDDNFIGDKNHARALLNELIPWMKEYGEPFHFWTQASLDLGQDKEMIDLMTAANFSWVVIGIETPDKEILRRTHKYQNINSPLVESLKNICENGLSVMGTFIIGFDGEEKGSGERICDLVEETAIPIAGVGTLHALPNTKLWRRLEKEGRLLKDRTSGDYLLGNLNFIPTRPESDIVAEWADSWDYLYEPRRYMARSHRFYLAMRPTRRTLAAQKGVPLPSEPPRAKIPLRKKFKEFIGTLMFIWWHGIKPSYRLESWKDYFAFLGKNYSRRIPYLFALALGQDMFLLRDEHLRRAARWNLNTRG